MPGGGDAVCSREEVEFPPKLSSEGREEKSRLCQYSASHLVHRQRLFPRVSFQQQHRWKRLLVLSLH